MLHKILVPFLFTPAAFSGEISCYGGSAFTACSNGTSIYNYGAMTEITTPGQPDTTIYRYGKFTIINNPTINDNAMKISPVINNNSNIQLKSFVLEPFH